MTTGPWKPIHLESYAHRIDGVDIRSNVSETLDVKLSAYVCIDGSQLSHFAGTSPLSLSITLKDPDGLILKAMDRILLDKTGCATAAWEYPAGELKLWYPVGYGKQPLYTIEFVLLDEVRVFFPPTSVMINDHSHMQSNVICWIKRSRELHFAEFESLRRSWLTKRASHSYLKSTISGSFVVVSTSLT